MWTLPVLVDPSLTLYLSRYENPLAGHSQRPLLAGWWTRSLASTTAGLWCETCPHPPSRASITSSSSSLSTWVWSRSLLPLNSFPREATRDVTLMPVQLSTLQRSAASHRTQCCCCSSPNRPSRLQPSAAAQSTPRATRGCCCCSHAAAWRPATQDKNHTYSSCYSSSMIFLVNCEIYGQSLPVDHQTLEWEH